MTMARLLATAALITATGAIATETLDEQIAQLEASVEQAYLVGDTEFLERLLADDFVFTHGTGTKESKADTLAGFARAGNFTSRELTDIEVEAHGDAALTTGRIEIVSSRPAEYTICYLRLYVRSGGQWRLASHRTIQWGQGHEVACK